MKDKDMMQVRYGNPGIAAIARATSLARAYTAGRASYKAGEPCLRWAHGAMARAWIDGWMAAQKEALSIRKTNG